EPDAAAELAERCARLPLALRIAAELASAHPDAPLAELLAELTDGPGRLDRFDATGDPRTAVRAVFSWSYQHLSPAGAHAFGRFGLHPGPWLDIPALAALAGTDADRTSALVDELARAHLIEPAAPGYAMHDLLRAYAVEQVGPRPRRAALTGLLDHYRDTAGRAAATLFPHDQRPDLVGAGLCFETEPAAQVWLDQHRANLVAVAVHAARHGWAAHALDLSQHLWRYFEVGGHYQE